MLYGIGLRYTVNPVGWRSKGQPINFVGQQCACHANWGLPNLFDSHAAAYAYAVKHYGLPSKTSTVQWEVIPERLAWLRVGNMVELVTGRRQILPCTGEIVIDPTKPSYQDLLPFFQKLAGRVARDKARQECYRLTHRPFVYGKSDINFT